MTYRIMFSLFVLITIGCKKEKRYYPPKHPEINQTQYDQYINKLDTAYAKGEDFDIGLCLVNLQASSKKIFHHLDIGIRQDTQNCYRVYEWYRLFKKDNFIVNLVRADTLKFEKSYQLCVDLMGEQTFINYEEQKRRVYQERLARRIKLDSTNFNMELITELQKIREDDQELRNKMDEKGLTPLQIDSIWQIQSKIDSINLAKVERVIDRFGYPNKERVGYDLVSVVWLILHHQSDINVRDKYQKLIEDNVSEGLLSAYNWRSKNIRLENSNK